MAEIKNDDGTAYRAFVCQTINPWGFPAGDRSGRLAMIEEPHLGRLMEKSDNLSPKQRRSDWSFPRHSLPKPPPQTANQHRSK